MNRTGSGSIQVFTVSAALVAALLGVAIGVDPATAVVLLLGCFSIVLAVLSPIAALYASVVLAFSVEGLAGAHLLPASSQFLSDGLLLATALSALLRAMRLRTARWPILAIPLLAALFVSVASAVYNATPLLVALLGMRALLKYSLVYVAIVMIDPGPRFLRGLPWLLVALAFLQVPVAIAQYVAGGSDHADLVTGTLSPGMSGVLAIWLIFTIGFAFRLQSTREPRARLLTRLAPLLLLIPVALNSTTITFVLAPVVVLWVLFSPGMMQNRTRALGVSLVLVLGVGLAYSVYLSGGGLPVTDVGAVRQYMTTQYSRGNDAGGRMRRIPMASFAVATVRSGSAVVLGYGPGSASKRVLAGVAGTLSEANPNAGLTESFFSQLTLELGLAGWLALGLLLAGVARMWAAGKRRVLSNYAQAIIGATLFLALLQTVLVLYAPVWTAPALAVSFWSLAGLSECLVRGSANVATGSSVGSDSSLLRTRQDAAGIPLLQR